MVHLTKIYTKTGDNGTTSIYNNVRVDKVSQIVEAIGAVDEANSVIGMIDRSEMIDQIQSHLFDIGAELSGAKTVETKDERVELLETYIDDYNDELEPLNSFILPTGVLHNARAVVRRAEREVWRIEEPINSNIAKYLNRLSDLLFVMARYHNKEKLWKPMA